MPELPEVETTARGIAPHLTGALIEGMVVRDRRLRWPVPAGIEARLTGRTVRAVTRRAKYLLLDVGDGHLMIHLGMSGSLRIVPGAVPPEKHDHFDLVARRNGEPVTLRYRDPRRFGMCDWVQGPPEAHRLLAHLGPEPFEERFRGAYLHKLAAGRRAPVKAFLMDGRIVVGVGNIYANEALHRARIRPTRPAGRISRARYDELARHVVAVLQEAIDAGGSTLRDFVSSTGQPGYFQQAHDVYGRAGEPCPCGAGVVQHAVVAQRATYFCGCQR